MLHCTHYSLSLQESLPRNGFSILDDKRYHYHYLRLIIFRLIYNLSIEIIIIAILRLFEVQTVKTLH